MSRHLRRALWALSAVMCVVAVVACPVAGEGEIGKGEGERPAASGDPSFPQSPEGVPFTCEAPRPAGEDLLPPHEREARAAYDCAPLGVEGLVLDDAGAPLAGARVRLQNREVRTGADGRFTLGGIARRNAFLQVEADGHRSESHPVFLRRGLEEKTAQLDPVRLAPVQAERARLVFTGDFALGRRFLDPSGTTPRDALPPDDPNALIRVSDPAPGSRAVVRHVVPLTSGADLTVVNLESPVTSDPRTPHGTKDFVFFTLPGSLAALHDLNARYVSLGNNHVYDYEELGVADTVRHLDAAGIGHSGAGRNHDEAFRPWSTALGGREVAFVSACSIAGDVHESNYVAGAAKGGAADLRDTVRMGQTIAEARAQGRVPIALLHTGIEYSEEAGRFARERGELSLDQGAQLVVAHHPHRLQGVSRHDGRLIFDSLGNFAFDQDRLETMIGGLAEVDLVAGEVDRAALRPVYLEDYGPRPIAGRLAEVTLRALAEQSRKRGVALTPSNGRGLVAEEGASVPTRERTVTLEVDVLQQGFAVIDLRPVRREGESLASAQTDAGTLRAGRDILLHGDFEDYDVDDEAGETVRWYAQEGVGFACTSGARRGANGLCLGQLTAAPVGANLRNRLRVPGDELDRPDKALTVLGSVRGEGAGTIELDARFYASDGDAEFGGQNLFRHAGGDFGWTEFAKDVSMPADPSNGNTWNSARALRLFFTHGPSASGAGAASGVVAFDELAVIAWDGSAGKALTRETPNARDFLRLQAQPGRHRVTITLRHHEG